MRTPHPFPLLLALVATSVAPLSGCAPQHDCHNSCAKLFGSNAGECAIQIPGSTDANGQADILDTCENYCEQAMSQAGEVGDYDPNVKSSGNEDVGLANDAQAALWMDCVDETDCTDLGHNYCAPTTNFPD